MLLSLEIINDDIIINKGDLVGNTLNVIGITKNCLLVEGNKRILLDSDYPIDIIKTFSLNHVNFNNPKQ